MERIGIVCYLRNIQSTIVNTQPTIEETNCPDF